MRPMVHVTAALLVAAAACSATGNIDAPEGDTDLTPDGGDTVVPEAAPEDAGSEEETSQDAGLDAERALVCGDAGFCETRLPKSDLGLPLSLRSVWAVDAAQVWSVTAEGFVLRFDGASWMIDYRANHELHSVWATPTDVWVGGEAGLLLHRSASGNWTHVETNHVAPIRAIYGTAPNDVWFTRDDASIDHFDGAQLDNHPVDVPGLRISVLFGKPDLGVYAAGHVPGPPSSGYRDDRAHVFSASVAGITPFNELLPERSGLVPLSGGVNEQPDAGPKVFLLGYQLYGETLRFLQAVSFTANDALKVSSVTPSPTLEEVARPIPVLAFSSESVWITRAMGLIHSWNGTALTPMSLRMGYDVSPAPVFGAHSSGSDVWLVGNGFALRGPTP